MRIRIMKNASVLISSLLFSLTAVSSVAFADGNSQSRNVFIEGTIQGNWKPAVTSVSNETPDVGKSLDLFANSVLGKTPRITPAVAEEIKPGKTETAAETFTSRFQTNYRYSKS
jgi:hypothetical protein